MRKAPLTPFVPHSRCNPMVRFRNRPSLARHPDHEGAVKRSRCSTSRHLRRRRKLVRWAFTCCRSNATSLHLKCSWPLLLAGWPALWSHMARRRRQSIIPGINLNGSMVWSVCLRLCVDPKRKVRSYQRPPCDERGKVCQTESTDEIQHAPQDRADAPAAPSDGASADETPKN